MITNCIAIGVLLYFYSLAGGGNESMVAWAWTEHRGYIVTKIPILIVLHGMFGLFRVKLDLRFL